jgi:anti-anti-sigma regulatory factor
MLKITITNTPTEQKWILCGRLTEPWVSELRSNWTNTRGQRQGRHCIVDLESVTFIDQSGECILVTMMSEGV